MNLSNDTAFKKKPSNFFGELYPSYDHNELINIFGILPDDKVLDIGSGHNPFSRANYFVDFDLIDDVHRHGQRIPSELKDRYMAADIHQLPFKDKSIDFVFCSHILEHVSDPSTACQEIMRVGKRGYIETPRKWTEFFAGYPSHQWLIDVTAEELIFKRRQFIESPYLNCLFFAVWKSKKLEEHALRLFLNISCVQFYWEEEFKFRVIDNNANRFDYSNPYHAAMSHFYFAKNILTFDAPPEHGIFHAEKSVMLCPDVEIFWILCAAYALILNNKELWSKTSKFLHDKHIINRRDIFFLKLGFKKAVIKKLIRILEENDPAEKN